MAEQYRRYAQAPAFQPRAVESSSEAMSAELGKRLQDLKTFNAQVMQRDQNLLEDARLAGQDIEAFGRLSQTFTELGKEQYKRDQKNIDIGRQAGSFYPGFDRPEPGEADLIELGEEQNRTLVPLRDSAGNPQVAQLIEDRRRVGRGLQGEKALLKDAVNRYPAFFMQYINGTDKIKYDGEVKTVSQLLSEPGDDFYDRYEAVKLAARYKFIEDNNLQYTTKKNFVEIFRDSALATESNIGLNMTTQRIKQGQEDELIEQDNLLRDQITRAKGVISLADMQGVWNSSEGTYLAANTGLTMTGSNARRAAVLAQAILENEDPVAAQANLRTLRLVQQVPGQKGSELGRIYGREIDKAVFEASDLEKKRDGILADQILNRMNADLEGIDNPVDRIARIKKAASELRGLRSRVGSTEADRLLGDINTRSLSDDYRINDAILEDQIRRDDLPDPDVVENGYRLGKYSAKTYQNYQDAWAQRDKAKEPETKAVFDGYSDTINREANLALGMKKDPTGKWTLVGKPLTYVPQTTANSLLVSIERDLIKERNRVLRNSQALTDSERASELDAALQAWYETNFKKEGGKYYLNGFWGANRSDRTNATKGKANFGAAFEAFNDPDFRAKPSSLPVQQQSNFNLGQPMSASVALDYSPTRGDTLFGYETVIGFKEDWEGGSISPELQLAASDVGMSPLDLLNYELIANRESTVKPKVDAAAIAGPMQGSMALEMAGFPSRSAGYLAAVVDSQGKWEDPESLELDKWAEELRLENPRAYRLLMNPNASMRHIKLAVNMILPDLPDVSAYANYLTA